MGKYRKYDVRTQVYDLKKARFMRERSYQFFAYFLRKNEHFFTLQIRLIKNMKIFIHGNYVLLNETCRIFAT